MPPMVCFGYAGNNGFVSEKNIRTMKQKGKRRSSLIIVEATCIARDGRLAEAISWAYGQTNILKD